MWVDPRIRDGTDIFVKCEDTSLTPEGLAQRRDLGVTCKWTIYPMSRILTGWTYSQIHKTLGPAYVTAKPYWGIMDTYQLQQRGSYSVKLSGGQAVDVDFTPSAATVQARSKWGWLYEAIQGLHDQGIERIDASQLWEYLQLGERELLPSEVGPQLKEMGLTTHHGSHGYFYSIDEFDLNKMPKAKELVLVR